MLRNYLKIALRTFWRQRLYVSLNVFGLAAGLTCVVLAVLYVNDEHRFDDFHAHNPHLYRITTTYVQNRGDQRETNGGTGQVQGPTFAAQVPEVQRYVRVMGGDIYAAMRTDAKALKVQPLYVDPSFLTVFSFPLRHGDPKTALREVNTVVVTERTARRFFGRTDVVGRLLSLDGDPSAQRLGNRPLVISGVVQDPPVQSSLQFDVLHPFAFMQLSFEDTNWLNAYLGTFVVLHPKADLRAVTQKFNALYAIHARQQLAESRRTERHDPRISYGLQPMTDIHLHPLHRGNGNREGGVINGSSPVFSYLFLGIAGFILLMASINFINISIASALQRAKEVGIRKVTGGRRSQLIGQFLGESVLLCALAFGLALVGVQVLLPTFNSLTDKAIALAEALDGPLIGWLAGVFVVNVLLAGFYPAYRLSGVSPTTALYQRQRLAGRYGFGRALVVVQFSLAVFLLIATLVFHGQMTFLRTKELGYNPYQVVRTYVGGNHELRPVTEFLKNEVAREPSLRQISFGEEWGPHDTQVRGRTVPGDHHVVDRQYLTVLGLRLRTGRNFASETAREILVNEAYVKAAGLTAPLGTLVRLHERFGETPLRIVGVLRDFHSGSLRERIRPLVLVPNDYRAGGIWLKIDKNRQPEALAAFARIYKKALPGAVYEYDFLDELNARAYAQERRWQRIIGYVTALSLLICAIGLFGLAHLTAEQRTKEIGVRKVLGASVLSLVALLSKDFLKLVLLALVVASPLAGYVLNRWLSTFAYRIDLNAGTFLLAGLLAVAIALVTVSFQAVKAALANPVKSLRSE